MAPAGGPRGGRQAGRKSGPRRPPICSNSRRVAETAAWVVEAARCDGVRRSSRRVGGSGVASRCCPATVALRDGVGERDGAVLVWKFYITLT